MAGASKTPSNASGCTHRPLLPIPSGAPLLHNVLRDSENLAGHMAGHRAAATTRRRTTRPPTHGWSARGRRRHGLRAALVLALDFHTWKRLILDEQIQPDDATDMMIHLVRQAAHPQPDTAAPTSPPGTQPGRLTRVTDLAGRRASMVGWAGSTPSSPSRSTTACGVAGSRTSGSSSTTAGVQRPAVLAADAHPAAVRALAPTRCARGRSDGRRRMQAVHHEGREVDAALGTNSHIAR